MALRRRESTARRATPPISASTATRGTVSGVGSAYMTASCRRDESGFSLRKVSSPSLRRSYLSASAPAGRPPHEVGDRVEEADQPERRRQIRRAGGRRSRTPPTRATCRSATGARPPNSGGSAGAAAPPRAPRRAAPAATAGVHRRTAVGSAGERRHAVHRRHASAHGIRLEAPVAQPVRHADARRLDQAAAGEHDRRVAREGRAAATGARRAGCAPRPAARARGRRRGGCRRAARRRRPAPARADRRSGAASVAPRRPRGSAAMGPWSRADYVRGVGDFSSERTRRCFDTSSPSSRSSSAWRARTSRSWSAMCTSDCSSIWRCSSGSSVCCQRSRRPARAVSASTSRLRSSSERPRRSRSRISSAEPLDVSLRVEAALAGRAVLGLGQQARSPRSSGSSSASCRSARRPRRSGTRARLPRSCSSRVTRPHQRHHRADQ